MSHSSITKFINTINSCITNEKIIINENNKIVKSLICRHKPSITINDYIKRIFKSEIIDTELLGNLIIQKNEAGNRVIGGSTLYDELFNDRTFFSAHAKYLPLFEKCNLFLYYDTADLSVRDIYDNKLYASYGGPILGGKKYYKNNKKIKK